MDEEGQADQYCNVCYEDDVWSCDTCGKDLEIDIWCSNEQNHYCNQDCFPQIVEGILIKNT
jgi:hypothetical protein